MAVPPSRAQEKVVHVRQASSPTSLREDISASSHPPSTRTKEQRTLDSTEHDSTALTDAQIDERMKLSPLCDIDLTETAKALNDEQLRKLKRWIVRREKTFSDGVFVPREPLHNARMRIETIVKEPVLRSYPYRMNPDDCATVRKQIDDWKEHGVITDSISPWSSNVVLVRKADKKARVAIDYRKLNAITKKDAYMLPRVDHVFDMMSGMQFVSVTDCHSAFLQIPLDDKRSRELTAFVAPDGGLYEFLRTPFGLANSPAIWQRLIDDVLAGYKWQFVLAYVDDVAIFTKSDRIEDHIAHLDQVFDRLDANGLSVKASKTFLAHKELPFLGHIIGVDGIKPDPAKVKAFQDMPLPKNTKQLRSAFGSFSYYRKFVKNFSKIAQPLTAKFTAPKNTRPAKNAPFLNEEEARAFNKLKSALCDAPICLAHPDWSAPFEVHTDACKDGLGAVICNRTTDGERVIMYASRSTTPMEKKYLAYELEALAAVWATEVFRHYLYGRKFTIVTDHQALKWLMSREHGTRVMRWIMRLQELDFDIVHRSGKSNANADGLSRNPLESTRPYGEAAIEPLYTTLAHRGSSHSYPHGTLWNRNNDCMVVTRARSHHSGAITETPPILGRTKPRVSTRGQSDPQTPGPDGQIAQDSSVFRLNKPHIRKNTNDQDYKTSPRKRQRTDTHDTQHRPQAETQATDTPPVRPTENIPSHLESTLQMHSITHSYFAAQDKDAWTRKQVAALQRLDATLGPIIQTLEHSGGDHTVSKFRLADDGVLVITSSTTTKSRFKCAPRLVVPDSLKAFVLYLHHNFLLAGHQGRDRTLAAISKRFYWKHMNDDCGRWIRSCIPCRRRKTPRPHRTGLTQPMNAPHPLHTVAIDIVGICPETHDGDIYILTMIDVFTRYPVAVPIPNRRAETVMKALYEHLLCPFGMPTRILSDRGKEFIDAGLYQLCKWLGIIKVTTTGYQPQANGNIERFHRYLNAAMTILTKKDVSKWDWYLPAILFSYRVAPCESTGFSPYFLMYGREPQLPVDLYFRTKTDDHTGTTAQSYASSVANTLAQAYEYVRVAQYERAYRNRVARDVKRTQPTFELGSKVFYWYDKASEKTFTDENNLRTTIPSKWRMWWNGPYTVAAHLSPNVYSIEAEDGTTIKANVNRLISHRAWSEAYDDTSTSWVQLAGQLDSPDGPTIIPQVDIVQNPVKVGDMCAFPMRPTKECPRCFGIGKVVDIKNDELIVQWYGNTSERHMSTYRPSWYQSNIRKYYYLAKPQSTTHRAYTTADTGPKILKDDLALYGFKLQNNDKLSDSTLRTLAAHPDIHNFTYPP